ncbi:UDP-N-acetylglucosamine 2-epimerase (non-hydrolyzing) [Desertihabitans brevis]|uniref:UDP-N-acetylglucosamine 2-epimerase (Non-hydrolyzing) n=1 Tax=Desertihabitans brevis TaxID=2268447 RepID=A0A367YTJ5_9ACTN|nr:UDP-N-acetylglucosamine 2-epimerase (non-hydrolyzing) [Desertihabitans brevis]RCK69138.1 UDP-N-acetylglucosamine 2-epimerase (non-hydrolyzing) [Desertihabitans brevis]
MAPLLLHVAGARPNFPKLAPVLRALQEHPVEQLVVHTGQHYDDSLSGIFFRQLGMPPPDLNLAVGAGQHGAQTAAVLVKMEAVLMEHEPDVVVVYGDVNSTLAATLAAVKLHIPVAHVEAGLRSFDRAMPEEVNRLVVDRLAGTLLAPSADAVDNLRAEGIADDDIHLVGNPMIDTLLDQLPEVEATPLPLDDLPEPFVVATLHRPSNVDRHEDAVELTRCVQAVADDVDVVLPVHPRSRQHLAPLLARHPRVHLTEPLGYREFLALVRRCALVVTDSGGVQEETTVLGVPCLTLRDSTERPVTISHGTNRLVSRSSLLPEVRAALAAGRSDTWPVPPLWDGHSGERIARILVDRVTV